MMMSLGVPILLLLLFVGVFGGALSAGLGGASHGGTYIDYVVPGILLMTVGYGSSTTALAVNKDMTEGIIARFRTMAISRASVLTGHVVAAVARTMASIGLVSRCRTASGIPACRRSRRMARGGRRHYVARPRAHLARGRDRPAGQES